MKDILQVEGRLTPLSSKTHITYQFHLPEATDRLRVAFSYSPKRLEDPVKAKAMIHQALEQYAEPSQQERLKEKWESYAPLLNLLTLSVDDPDGFRGSAHRHPNEQLHLIGADISSPGFFSGRIQQGVWRVTISAHCIVTDNCEYQLLVQAEGGASDEVAAI
ncbi:hypothetical protein M6D81_19880 [Paenibacillus sp. J5C_2022]|uniref:hypothetical protein n=1 Tax=Paenibacillus sp. J5C2022 TaxID=2977129 RepID=UPI0021D30F09|nr:hypothetical protein [Paenibacillus sp. J5C2022]MCU6710960.1 hypothetical protein [Paenibacillus sp. J5C2022]